MPELLERRMLEATQREKVLTEGPGMRIEEEPGKRIISAKSVVFITDATGAGSISNKTYESGTSPSDKVLTGFESDNDSVTIHVEVDAGAAGGVGEGWQPVVSVCGGSSAVEINNLTRMGSYSRRFSGSATIDAAASGTISARTDDGGESQDVAYVRALDPPEVLSVQWENQGTNPDPYPAVQTQFKSGDVMQLSGTCETHADEVYVKDFEATSGRGLQGPYAVVAGAWTASNVYAGNGTGSKHVKAYAKVTGGTPGPDYTTSGTVECDQTVPTFSGGAQTDIAYPGSQEALKDSESCDITVTHTNLVAGDTYLYDANGTGELSIPETTTYSATKSGVSRASGNYRESGTNYRLRATRTEKNGASATKNVTVKIAHTFATITVNRYSGMDGTNKRLRTDDDTNGYYDHQIRLQADQAALSTDTPEIQGPPVGTFQGSWSKYNDTQWRRNLRIADADIVQGGQGSNTYAWNDSTTVSWVNRAGKETTAVTTGNSFTVGGFDARTLTIPAWPNREADTSVHAVDTSKLESENLSKGGEGPHGGTIFTFDNSPGEGETPDDEVDKFCMTNGSDIVDDDGRYWYNKDQANALSNTSGTAQVIVEETA